MAGVEFAPMTLLEFITVRGELCPVCRCADFHPSAFWTRRRECDRCGSVWRVVHDKGGVAISYQIVSPLGETSTKRKLDVFDNLRIELAVALRLAGRDSEHIDDVLAEWKQRYEAAAQ